MILPVPKADCNPSCATLNRTPGYVFRIGGGNDKQGFPMKQGILCNHRVRLLFKKGMSCFRERRKGCRKRKSVRGCVVGPDLAVRPPPQPKPQGGVYNRVMLAGPFLS